MKFSGVSIWGAPWTLIFIFVESSALVPENEIWLELRDNKTVYFLSVLHLKSYECFIRPTDFYNLLFSSFVYVWDCYETEKYSYVMLYKILHDRIDYGLD